MIAKLPRVCTHIYFQMISEKNLKLRLRAHPGYPAPWPDYMGSKRRPLLYFLPPSIPNLTGGSLNIKKLSVSSVSAIVASRFYLLCPGFAVCLEIAHPETIKIYQLVPCLRDSTPVRKCNKARLSKTHNTPAVSILTTNFNHTVLPLLATRATTRLLEAQSLQAKSRTDPIHPQWNRLLIH